MTAGRGVAFTWLMPEGAQVAVGGVAGYVRNLLAEQDAVREHLAARGWRANFVLAEPYYRPTAPGYDARRWEDTRAHLAARGGRAVRLISDGDGVAGWGGDRFFHALSAAGAQVVLDAAERYDAVIAVSGTSAFARLPGMVQRQAGESARRVLHVHTFGSANHDTALPPTPAEIAADADVAFWARQTARVTVGSISDYTDGLYTGTYALAPSSLLPNRSGIPLRSPRFAADDGDDARRLAGLGLPDRGRFVVMWGRNSAPDLDKGYHLLLGAASRLPGVVPVIATRRPDPGLSRLARDLGVPAVLLADQPFAVIAALLRDRRTAAAAFLGEAEPGSVSPMEALWVARDTGAVVVVAGTGNLPEVVGHGAAGIVAERTASGVADAIGRALALSPGERRTLREAGAALVRERFDFGANLRSLVDASLTRWEELT